MRTIFTAEDVKNIVEKIFNGNLFEHKVSNGSIAYVNPNSEKIVIKVDEKSRVDLKLVKKLS